MKFTTLASIAGTAAALLLASPAHALYTTLDPVASVSQLSVSTFSLTGGTAAVNFAGAAPTSLYLASSGKPASTSSGYNVLSTTYNKAGVAISEVRQAYQTYTYSSVYGVDFTLTGMSVATFNASLLAGTWSAASINVPGQSAAEVLPGVYARSTSSFASLTVSGAPFNASADAQLSQASVSANAYADNNGLYKSGAWINSFNEQNGAYLTAANLSGAQKGTSLAFLNLTGGAISGHLELRAVTTVTNLSATQVVAVPEADATVMALAGATLAGLLVKRRRARA